MIPLSEPRMEGNEWQHIKRCLDTGWVSTAGHYVEEFEKSFAQYIHKRYAVAFINGTAAIHISLLINGIGAGDEVIVPTLTFIAPVNMVRLCGAQPVFMDCDDYLNMDVDKLKTFLAEECEPTAEGLINKKSRRRIKAIMPVHIFGHPVDMATILTLAEQYDLVVIEDATEALGSSYTEGPLSGQKAGAVGTIGCFSFNGNKIITAGGGGMLVTDDEALARKARYLSEQAKDDNVLYLHNEPGFNYRLNNIQSAFGCAQLEVVDKHVSLKRENFSFYDKALGDIEGLFFIPEPDGTRSNYWFYSLCVESTVFGMDNVRLMKGLAEQDIQSRPIWYLNHKQRPYADCQSYHIERAEYYYDRVLNIPCSSGISADQRQNVVDAIRKFSRVTAP